MTNTEKSTNLPLGCILRPARSTDRLAILKLVLGAKLDPTQLRWSQFWVIECSGSIVACGQLRSFNEAQELGSLVVLPNWRGQGLGTLLSKCLIQQANEPLYLECVGNGLPQFYTRLGFEPITWQNLPRSLQWKFGVTQLLSRLLPFVSVTIMRYSNENQ